MDGGEDPSHSEPHQGTRKMLSTNALPSTVDDDSRADWSSTSNSATQPILFILPPSLISMSSSQSAVSSSLSEDPPRLASAIELDDSTKSSGVHDQGSFGPFRHFETFLSGANGGFEHRAISEAQSPSQSASSTSEQELGVLQRAFQSFKRGSTSSSSSSSPSPRQQAESLDSIPSSASSESETSSRASSPDESSSASIKSSEEVQDSADDASGQESVDSGIPVIRITSSASSLDEDEESQVPEEQDESPGDIVVREAIKEDEPFSLLESRKWAFTVLLEGEMKASIPYHRWVNEALHSPMCTTHAGAQSARTSMHSLKRQCRRRLRNMFEELVPSQWIIDERDPIIMRMERKTEDDFVLNPESLQFHDESEKPPDWEGPTSKSVFGNSICRRQVNPYRLVAVFSKRMWETGQPSDGLAPSSSPKGFGCFNMMSDCGTVSVQRMRNDLHHLTNSLPVCERGQYGNVNSMNGNIYGRGSLSSRDISSGTRFVPTVYVGPTGSLTPQTQLASHSVIKTVNPPQFDQYFQRPKLAIRDPTHFQQPIEQVQNQPPYCQGAIQPSCVSETPQLSSSTNSSPTSPNLQSEETSRFLESSSLILAIDAAATSTNEIAENNTEQSATPELSSALCPTQNSCENGSSDMQTVMPNQREQEGDQRPDESKGGSEEEATGDDGQESYSAKKSRTRLAPGAKKGRAPPLSSQIQTRSGSLRRQNSAPNFSCSMMSSAMKGDNPNQCIDCLGNTSNQFHWNCSGSMSPIPMSTDALPPIFKEPLEEVRRPTGMRIEVPLVPNDRCSLPAFLAQNEYSAIFAGSALRKIPWPCCIDWTEAGAEGLKGLQREKLSHHDDPTKGLIWRKERRKLTVGTIEGEEERGLAEGQEKKEDPHTIHNLRIPQLLEEFLETANVKIIRPDWDKSKRAKEISRAAEREGSKTFKLSKSALSGGFGPGGIDGERVATVTSLPFRGGSSVSGSTAPENAGPRKNLLGSLIPRDFMSKSWFQVPGISGLASRTGQVSPSPSVSAGAENDVSVSGTEQGSQTQDGSGGDLTGAFSAACWPSRLIYPAEKCPSFCEGGEIDAARDTGHDSIEGVENVVEEGKYIAENGEILYQNADPGLLPSFSDMLSRIQLKSLSDSRSDFEDFDLSARVSDDFSTSTEQQRIEKHRHSPFQREMARKTRKLLQSFKKSVCDLRDGFLYHLETEKNCVCFIPANNTLFTEKWELVSAQQGPIWVFRSREQTLKLKSQPITEIKMEGERRTAQQKNDQRTESLRRLDMTPEKAKLVLRAEKRKSTVEEDRKSFIMDEYGRDLLQKTKNLAIFEDVDDSKPPETQKKQQSLQRKMSKKKKKEPRLKANRSNSMEGFAI